MVVLVSIDPDVKILVSQGIFDVDLVISYNNQVLSKLLTVYLV